MTGFTQYWIYSIMRDLYFRGKYLLHDKFPHYNYYVKKWNTEIKDREGTLFYKLIDKIPKQKQSYYRLYGYYYLSKENFVISDIFNDEFALWNKYEFELRNLKTVVSSDFLWVLNYCKSHRMKIKDFFFNDKKIPLACKNCDIMNISIHSLIAFNKAFNFLDKISNTETNFIEHKKIKKYNLITTTYYDIIKPFYMETDWEEFLRTLPP